MADESPIAKPEGSVLLPGVGGPSDDSPPVGPPSVPPLQPLGDKIVSQFMARITSGFHPQESLIDRLDAPQLGKLLDLADEADKREDSRKRESMRLLFALVLSIPLLIAFLCLIFLYFQKGDLLREIVALLIGLGGGGAGGFGIGRATAKKL